MAAGDYQIALEGDFCTGAEGSAATTVQTNVDEVKLGMAKTVAKWLRRGKKFRGSKPTARDVSLEWKMAKFEADAFVATIKAAYVNDTRLAIYAKDPSGEGMDGDFYVTDWQEEQGNEGGIEISVKAEITDELRDPQYH